MNFSLRSDNTAEITTSGLIMTRKYGNRHGSLKFEFSLCCSNCCWILQECSWKLHMLYMWAVLGNFNVLTRHEDFPSTGWFRTIGLNHCLKPSMQTDGDGNNNPNYLLSESNCRLKSQCHKTPVFILKLKAIQDTNQFNPLTIRRKHYVLSHTG